MTKLLTMSGLLLALSGCASARASFQDTLPARNVTQCRALCDSAGMSLDAVVVVANQTGCVCGTSPAGGSAAATGGAVVVLQQQEQQQQQQ